MHSASTGGLKEYVERVKALAEHKEVSRNEEATKASLIGPLFTLLGWDLTRPELCIAEYKASFGRGRSADPIDWAFFHRERATFVVEAKRRGEQLRGHTEQLADYFHKAEVNLGILTNGVEWQFFSDTDRPNKMDNTPFIKWDVLHDERPPIELLSLLQRASYLPESVQSFAYRCKGRVLPSAVSVGLAARPAFKDLPAAERCVLIPRMLEEHRSARKVAKILGVDDKTVLNWSRASRLIPEVGEALLAGENTGLSLRSLRHFFNRTAHNNGHNVEAKPPEEQERLLEELRGRGRGGVKRKRLLPAS